MHVFVFPLANFCYFSGLRNRGDWQRLKLESCAMRKRGLAEGTWSNKVSHLRQFLVFTTHFRVQDFPVQLGVLLRFIPFLGRDPISFQYASNVISSVKYFAALLDPSSVKVFDALLVAASLKGLKAQLSRPVRQKLPFSLDHLYKFNKILDMNDCKQLSCWCAMLLAFFGCFRLSNLVPSSKAKFDPLKHFKRNDIRFEGDLVLVYFKWSKTNQHSSKVSWVPIGSSSDPRFSIKIQLSSLFSRINLPGSSPLFSYNKNEFHSRFSLVNLLNSCLLDARLSLNDYSWHSFRRGAAVFAFELGLADSAVQLLGDWSSAAFKNYLEFAFGRKANIARLMASNFDKQLEDILL